MREPGQQGEMERMQTQALALATDLMTGLQAQRPSPKRLAILITKAEQLTSRLRRLYEGVR